MCAIGGVASKLVRSLQSCAATETRRSRGSGKWMAVNWDQAIKEILEGGDLFGKRVGSRTEKPQGRRVGTEHPDRPRRLGLRVLLEPLSGRVTRGCVVKRPLNPCGRQGKQRQRIWCSDRVRSRGSGLQERPHAHQLWGCSS